MTYHTDASANGSKLESEHDERSLEIFFHLMPKWKRLRVSKHLLIWIVELSYAPLDMQLKVLLVNALLKKPKGRPNLFQPGYEFSRHIREYVDGKAIDELLVSYHKIPHPISSVSFVKKWLRSNIGNCFVLIPRRCRHTFIQGFIHGLDDKGEPLKHGERESSRKSCTILCLDRLKNRNRRFHQSHQLEV